MPDLRYVSRVGTDAWLAVTLESGERLSLPYGLAVDVTGFEKGRDHFKILEGWLKGKSASVRRDASTSHLVENIHHEGAAMLRFDRTKQELWVNGRGPYNAFSGHFKSFTQVPQGMHVLQIPDAPHPATREAYYAYASYHKTWFRMAAMVQRRQRSG
jgi:hypothetical protein